MHYYEKNIVDIKNIYTEYLINMISPLVLEGIKSMYTKSLEVEKQYDEAMLKDDQVKNPGVLKIFQHFLKGVPSLNSNLIESEMVRIRDSSKNADIFEKLIRAVFKSYIILLTFNASGKECMIVKEKYHEKIDIKDFIHKIYIETAKHFFNNPILFWHNYSSVEIKQNQLKCIEIIKEAIKEAILKALPLNDILTEYLRNEYLPEQSQQVRNMLDNENREVINQFDGGSIIDPNDNGVEELEEAQNANKIINELNQINNNDELLLKDETGVEVSEKKPSNSSDEYFQKINSLGGAFSHKTVTLPKINNNQINQNNESETKISIVKPNIVENKISNINKEEYYKAMFSEK